MHFVCLSDTHGLHDKVTVPEADVLLYTGDWSNRGSAIDAYNFASWLGKQPCKHKVVIAGNHDLFAEQNYDLTKRVFAENGCIYLMNEEVIVEGYKIYGSPFTPEFYNWSFMLARHEIYDKVWSKIPLDTDILLTHGPMYGVMDKVGRIYGDEIDPHVGCKGLSKRISELNNLKLFVFGHIHPGYGFMPTPSLPGLTKKVNASICNEKYQALNKPIEVIL